MDAGGHPRVSPVLALLLLLPVLGGCAWVGSSSRDPLTPREHLQLGRAYEEQGLWDLALREYRSAARADTLPEAYFYIGNLHVEQSRYDKALRAYERALPHLPEHPDLLNNTAWVLWKLNRRLDRAEELVRRALRLRPGHPPYEDTLQRIQDRRNGNSPPRSSEETAEPAPP